jgi:hypothetical protein
MDGLLVAVEAAQACATTRQVGEQDTQRIDSIGWKT